MGKLVSGSGTIKSGTCVVINMNGNDSSRESSEKVGERSGNTRALEIREVPNRSPANMTRVRSSEDTTCLQPHYALLLSQYVVGCVTVVLHVVCSGMQQACTAKLLRLFR